MLILQLPGYYLGSKGNNKLSSISWDHTHRRINFKETTEKKNKQKSDLELKISK